MQNTVLFLDLHGNIMTPQARYQKVMVEQDTKESGFSMTDPQNRDSFHIGILENPGLDTKVEYRVTQLSSLPFFTKFTLPCVIKEVHT